MHNNTHQHLPHRLLLSAALTLLISACSMLETSPKPAPATPVAPPQAVVHEGDENPYQTIDQAVASAVSVITQNSFEASATAPVVTVAAEPRTLWQRFQSEFSLPQCEPGSRAADWAAWYGERQEYMDRVLQRARPWLYDIAEELAARQLPADLVLLPIVESAFDPFAVSRGRAVGTWQFVRGTAGDFGLRIDDWYDGRRDVYAASRAALDYLRFLFDKFDGDWRLALAAYNGGQGRVDRALRRYRGNSVKPTPRELRLPLETRSYAPKLHGLSCLVRNIDDYPIQLPDIPDQPQITTMEVDSALDLVLAARLAGLDVAELYALNPGFSRWATPPRGPHRLVLPIAKADEFQDRLNRLPRDQWVQWRNVIVQPGDTLSAIASRSGISVSELMAANKLQSSLIRPGQELRLLGGDSAQPDTAYQQQFARLQELQGRLVRGPALEHRVRAGESLWTIARRYNVSTRDLARWNGLSNGRLIHPGQRLRIASGSSSSGSVGATATAAATPTEHKVRRGESPWTIARRYRLKLEDLLRWNQLTSDSILRPGQRLRLQPAGQG